MAYQNRKTIRLPTYDYNTPGYYFITICTKGKQNLLCKIVGTDLPGGPQITFSPYGHIAQRQMEYMSRFYKDILVDQYVIMPNHIHLILRILPSDHGPSGRPVPTNSKLSNFVGTFKRFCNRQYGENIWQSRSHDHVIRNDLDYQRIWTYIDENPIKWKDDCFYTPD